MTNGFEQEDHDIMTEIKIALITVVAVIIWAWSTVLTDFDLSVFPTTTLTGVLLVLGGIWIGFVIKRRKRRTGSIRKERI